jgi:hypothetical protein
MSHANAILAAMTQRLANATAAGLPCGVPTHSAPGLAEELGTDLVSVARDLGDLCAAGTVERLPGRDACGCRVYRLVQAAPA